MTEASPAPSIQVTIHDPAPIKYLWAKDVTGFDPGKACARSLEGKYLPGIPYGRQREGTRHLDPKGGKHIYVCAVTPRYDDNVHVALRKSDDPNQITEVVTPLLTVKARGYTRDPIPPIPEQVPATKHQKACRNYRWGYNTFLTPESQDA